MMRSLIAKAAQQSSCTLFGNIHDKYSQGKTEISHNLQGLSHR